jgi:hypothetical protein
MMRPFDIPIAIVILVGLALYIFHHLRRGGKEVHVTDGERG